MNNNETSNALKGSKLLYMIYIMFKVLVCYAQKN